MKVNSVISAAAKLEAEKKYNEALIIYENIINMNLNNEELVYVKRSIAACKYYLKDYECAEKEFKKILDENNISTDEREEIEDCMYLCCLYGGKPEKAERYFTNKLELYKNDYKKNMWDYWYAGQIYFLKNEYVQAEKMYMHALNAAESADNSKVKFFLAHVIGTEIILEKYTAAWENIKKRNNYADTSSGLYKIVVGILKKCCCPNDSNWKIEYNEGVAKAKADGFEENIELGKVLLEKTVRRH